MTDPMRVFDRALVRRRRDRAAPAFDRFDFLVRRTADDLLDRLLDVRRGFGRALDLGAGAGVLAGRLAGFKGIAEVVACDLSPAMLAGAPGLAVAADEELLPFAESSFDLVVSNLSLHWVNDLPGALVQAQRALRPDGLFLAAMLGGDTLFELRRALLEAELEATGGASLRLSPAATLRDAAGLLQRAGFALPVADSAAVTVTYSSMFDLLADLRGMGAANAALARDRRPRGRAFWADAASRYAALFAEPDGRVPATFEVLFLTGWAPHESQPRPLRPGSAAARLADALGTVEHRTGVGARP